MEDLIDVPRRCLIIDGRRGVPAEHLEDCHGPLFVQGKNERSSTRAKWRRPDKPGADLHARHLGFRDVAVAVQVVQAEDPAHLLLGGAARGLRQRLQEVLQRDERPSLEAPSFSRPGERVNEALRRNSPSTSARLAAARSTSPRI